MIKNFIVFYTRGLEALESEFALFKNEENMWKTKEGITNSCGNLILHLIGNLNHFIGAEMGDTGYIRKREEEFSSKNISRSDLLKELKTLQKLIPEILVKKSEAWLESDFKTEFQGAVQTNEFMLTQMLVHLNYHAGQINYLRRIIES